MAEIIVEAHNINDALPEAPLLVADINNNLNDQEIICLHDFFENKLLHLNQTNLVNVQLVPPGRQLRSQDLTPAVINLLQLSSNEKFSNIKVHLIDHFEIEIPEVVIPPNSVKNSIKYFYWFFEIYVIVSSIPGFNVQHLPNNYCIWNNLARRVTELVLLSFMQRGVCPITLYGVNDAVVLTIRCPPGNNNKWKLLWLTENCYNPSIPNLNGHSNKEVYNGYKAICAGFSSGRSPLQLLYNAFRNDFVYDDNNIMEASLMNFLRNFREKYRNFAAAKGNANNYGM